MSKETELHERVARIEQQLEDYLVRDKERSETITAIDEKLDHIDKELSRYRGIVGGILLVVTSVVTFFKFFWDDMTRLFSK